MSTYHGNLTQELEQSRFLVNGFKSLDEVKSSEVK